VRSVLLCAAAWIGASGAAAIGMMAAGRILSDAIAAVLAATVFGF